MSLKIALQERDTCLLCSRYTNQDPGRIGSALIPLLSCTAPLGLSNMQILVLSLLFLLARPSWLEDNRPQRLRRLLEITGIPYYALLTAYPRVVFSRQSVANGSHWQEIKGQKERSRQRLHLLCGSSSFQKALLHFQFFVSRVGFARWAQPLCCSTRLPALFLQPGDERGFLLLPIKVPNFRFFPNSPISDVIYALHEIPSVDTK